MAPGGNAVALIDAGREHRNMCITIFFRTIIFVLSIAAAEAQTIPGALHGTLGANKFDLLMQYEGTASNGGGTPAAQIVTSAMGVKAIADAANNGFAFVRVAASGYGPMMPTQRTDPQQNDLLLWMQNPASYWSAVDQMFNDLDAHQIKLVPNFIWNPFQFPALAGETLATMLTTQNSQSRSMLYLYVRQFINRYRGRPTILFYEMTNELNLEADIDIAGLCRANSPAASCAAFGDFTTTQMINFTQHLAGFMRALDPTRRISSGYGLPRPAAYHLMLQPSFSPQGPDWTKDSPAQFQSLLIALHAPFDLISSHIYPGDVRWGNPAGTEYLTLDAVAAAARASGKEVYLGEFGDRSDSSYIAAMLQRMVADRVSFASVWIWEFYQNSTWQSTDVTFAPGVSLEPGFTNSLNATLRKSAGPGSWNDPGTPRVVLTAPLPCATVEGSITLYAVASARQPIDRVTFYVDGVPVGSSTTPPYHVTTTVQGSGVHHMRADAISGYMGGSTGPQPMVFSRTPTVCSVPG